MKLGPEARKLLARRLKRAQSVVIYPESIDLGLIHATLSAELPWAGDPEFPDQQRNLIQELDLQQAPQGIIVNLPIDVRKSVSLTTEGAVPDGTYRGEVEVVIYQSTPNPETQSTKSKHFYWDCELQLVKGMVVDLRLHIRKGLK